MSWFARLFRRKHRSITVSVGADLHQVFARMADRDGLSIEAWAQRVLTNAVPQKELRAVNRQALRAAGLDAVFDQLDKDEAYVPNLLSLAPPAAPRPKLPVVAGHPCAHLRAGAPEGSRLTVKDCQGTCASPQQDGRVCHWPSAVATQCPVFEPRFKPPKAARG